MCANKRAVSILVITRDRREMLNRLLNDLHQQQYSGVFEIVVVEETADPCPPEGVKYVPHPMCNKGIAFARNLSLEHASHDLLVFIDDDCRVDPDWLERLVAPMNDQIIMGVQGGVTVPEGTGAIGWAETLLGFPGGGVTRIFQSKGEVQKTTEVSTLNAAYRKDAVIAAGGFSDQARFGGEDFLLAKEVAKQGRLYFVPDAEVRHEARDSLIAIWRWFVRRGRAEYDMWHNHLSPKDHGGWMLRSSLSIKLLPLLMLCFLSIWPVLAVMVAMVISNMWRFRWVLGESKIPFAAWWWLPWVRMLMSFASDVGRLKAWLNNK